jgi:molybdopterin molybdotransferase
MKNHQTSYKEALQLTLDQIQPLFAEKVALPYLSGRVLAEDIFSLADSPSADASLRDGYAFQAADTASASPQHPICLQVEGFAAAGTPWKGKVTPGKATRILTGAQLPKGADTVVASEFTQEEGNQVWVSTALNPGENILLKGSDVASGQPLFVAGKVLQPTNIGLLAAAGHSRVAVVKRPRVAIIATGDEVVSPGLPLKKGQLFASNLIALSAWCVRYGMQITTSVVGDHTGDIGAMLADSLSDHDAIITIGGTWMGEHDLVIRSLDELVWKKVYHRVRMIPGKTVAFGVYRGKPVFCLPGGPPASHMAFLQLALPGLRKMAGYKNPQLPTLPTRLTETVNGTKDWTTFIPGRLETTVGEIHFRPLKISSRLQAISLSEAIIAIPEDTAQFPAGAIIQAQVWDWTEF